MQRTWSCSPCLVGLIICFGFSSVVCEVIMVSAVGLKVVLPCKWTWRMEQPSPGHKPYIQWQTLSETVFERMGREHFEGGGYEGRADVPEEMLDSGNCSLLLQDIRFSDAGRYESYLVVGQSSIKTRRFIQSVQLSVFDHKDTKTVKIGEKLELDLHTQQATTVVFQGGDNSEWKVVWNRDSKGPVSGEMRRRGMRVVMEQVGKSDAGIYKVLDSQGLALSTVTISVTETIESTVKETNLSEKQQMAVDRPVETMLDLFIFLHFTAPSSTSTAKRCIV
ncbi:galectin 17 [Chanos chanos]|uniref:Galectin 17 n=1 Tax=Chanos chanos TaxID=29144 RepID=A0A6J2WNL1_CHACN|nr:uncharacterized protein LOC115825451 [Chanos chanos]